MSGGYLEWQLREQLEKEKMKLAKIHAMIISSKSSMYSCEWTSDELFDFTITTLKEMEDAINEVK